MRVKWDDKAERNRDLIGYYILDRFGPDSLDQFVDEVEQTVRMIMKRLKFRQYTNYRYLL